MQLCVALLPVFAVLALAGSAVGDGTAEECTLVQGRTLFEVASDVMAQCSGLDLKELHALAVSHEEAPQYRHYCWVHELVKECIATTMSDKVSACQDETDRAALVALGDVLKAGHGYSCVEHGELLESVSSGVLNVESSTPEKNLLTDCLAAAKSTPGQGHAGGGLSARMTGLYREINAFKECLMDGIRGSNRAIFGAELMLNALLHGMECPRPDDGTKVPCKTLVDVAPSTDDHACVVEGGDTSYDDLLKYSALCATVNADHLQVRHLANFSTVDEYRNFFATYCPNRPRVRECFDDAMKHSKACQNATEHAILKTLVDFMDHGLETGCRRDGVDFGTIFSGFFNRVERGMSDEKMNECLDAYHAREEDVTTRDGSLAYKILMFYRNGATLTKCYTEGAYEEGAFKTVFPTFMNEVLAAANCVNPDDESVVAPCASLLQNIN